MDIKIGNKFGKWTIIKHLGLKIMCKYVDRGTERYMRVRHFLCRCECGCLKEITMANLKSGRSKGCTNCHTLSLRKLGYNNKSEYNTYRGMLQRCNNPNSQGYKHYGGRGIKICDRWLDKKNGFETFFKDMGKKPSKKHSIERINVDGNYEPSNCKWATVIEQMNNRQHTETFNVLDEFSPLKLSNERKRQLRKKKKGLCRRSCNDKIFKSDLCERHYQEALDWRRLWNKSHKK